SDGFEVRLKDGWLDTLGFHRVSTRMSRQPPSENTPRSLKASSHRRGELPREWIVRSAPLAEPRPSRLTAGPLAQKLSTAPASCLQQKSFETHRYRSPKTF